MELIGKLERVLDPETGQGKNGPWKKQLFVVETLGNFPKKVAFQVWGDKADGLANFRTGDIVKVYFDPESREFNGKFYTDLRAWRIDAENGASNSGYTNSAPSPQNTHVDQIPSYQNDDFNASSQGMDDDLPF